MAIAKDKTEKDKALEAALLQIDKKFEWHHHGTGGRQRSAQRGAISTGSITLISPAG